MVEKTSQPFVRNVLAQTYIYAGRMDEARRLHLELHPEMFGDEDVIIDMPNAHFTIDVATLLYWTGERDRANYLFDRVLEYFQTLHRTRGAPFGHLDVQIHAIRGEHEKAIVALQEAYDMGWRLTAWQLRLPPFDALSGNPKWDEIVDLFEADLVRQRQWYEEHKDEPLL